MSGIGDNYWFVADNIQQIKSQINVIIENYSMVSKYAMDLANVMKKYINQPGKWNDDNSIKVANWWNNTNGVQNGKLVVDSEKGLNIVASTAEVSKYGGEGRVKLILKECAKLYWLSICRPLYYVVKGKFASVETSFSSEMYASMGDGKEDKTYAFNTIDGGWMFMNKYVKDDSKKFKTTALEIKNSPKGSNFLEISNFRDEIKTCITNFANAIDEYKKSIKPFVDDTTKVKHEYFGFYPNTEAYNAYSKVVGAANANIFEFKENLINVIKKYCDELSVELSKYLNLPFDGRK